MRMRRFIIIAGSVVFVAVALTSTFRWAKASLQRRAESVSCGNTMVSIMCAARLWANDNNERLPPNLLAMSNELNTPKILRCPGDRTRQRVGDWAEFTDANSTYEVLSPGAPDWSTNIVYLRCKLHGHLGYPDATVFDGKERRTKKVF